MLKRKSQKKYMLNKYKKILRRYLKRNDQKRDEDFIYFNVLF
jgi:hypothetical protein